MSDSPPAVTIEDVRAARERIAGAVRVTPLWPSVSLSDLAGVPVLLKCEQLQRAGSFKFRGASNMLESLEEKPRGVIAASAGNHAQGVALAAAQRGLPATVVMPTERAPRQAGRDARLRCRGGAARRLDRGLHRAGPRARRRARPAVRAALRQPGGGRRAGHTRPRAARAGARGGDGDRAGGRAAGCSPALRSRSSRCGPRCA